MTVNQVGAIACLSFFVLFGIMGVVFAFLKEKGAMLISGFNTLPKEEIDKYDKKRMSADMKNSFLIWTGLMLIGGALSYFVSFYFALIAFTVWIVLFLKDIKMFPDKAFEKYRL